MDIKLVPGTISGAQVNYCNKTLNPYLYISNTNIVIQYQIIDKVLYRSVEALTACGHSVVIEVHPIPTQELKCNCKEGCLNQYRTVVNNHFNSLQEEEDLLKYLKLE